MHMDETEHEHQVKILNEETDPNRDTTERVVDYCMFLCGESAEVAWKLGYDRPGRRMAYTSWIYVCDLCDGESKGLAPYWWNKALRGESLEDEEE
jgi:hypothetical protein